MCNVTLLTSSFTSLVSITIITSCRLRIGKTNSIFSSTSNERQVSETFKHELFKRADRRIKVHGQWFLRVPREAKGDLRRRDRGRQGCPRRRCQAGKVCVGGRVSSPTGDRLASPAPFSPLSPSPPSPSCRPRRFHAA